VGIVTITDALRLAQESDLDLVEVAPTARPPVCKLMDYGKFKYESALKARESRKNQAQTVIKEIKIRPKIDPHDYGTKKGHVERFLKQGDKVKVTIMFRGREQSRPELGYKLLQRLAGDVEELGFVESQPKQDGRNMIMVIGPHRKKADTKTVRGPDRASARAAAPGASAGRPQVIDDVAEAEPATAWPNVDASQPDVGLALAGQVGEPAQAGQVEAAAPSASEAGAAAPVRPVAAAASRPSQSASSGPRTATAGSAGPRPAAPTGSAGPRPGPSAAGAARPASPRPGPAAAGAARPATPRPGQTAASGPRPAAPAPGSSASATPRPAAPRPTAPKPGPVGARPAAPKPSAPRPPAGKPADSAAASPPRPRSGETSGSAAGEVGG
jgi:translation initiation factor IF-3